MENKAGNKFVYESFEDFVNYKLLMETATPEDLEYLNETDKEDPKKGSTEKSKTSPWDFKFDSGKFRKSDVTEEQLKKLEDDIEKRIVPVLNNQDYIGQKVVINVSSASSKVPVNKSGAVAKELQSVGLKADNKSLCEARGNTVVELIKDMLYRKFGKGMKEDVFFNAMDKKLTFVNKPMPNIGPAYSGENGDNPNDQKFKNNQFISATLEASGEKLPPNRFLICNTDKSFSGGKADASNGYAGYDETLYLKGYPGQTMEISFNPLSVPDAMLFHYQGEAPRLTPFMGSVGAIMVYGEATPELEAKYASTQPGSIATTKLMLNNKTRLSNGTMLGGKEYLVCDYKQHLNDVVNKGGVLVAAIEAKLKSLGLKTIKELCPNFFDADGKIEVYTNENPREYAQNGTKPGRELTEYLLQYGALTSSPRIDNKVTSVTLRKSIMRDQVTLVAFSPVSGTLFQVKTTCKA
jgi:hypothetical protein